MFFKKKSRFKTMPSICHRLCFLTVVALFVLITLCAIYFLCFRGYVTTKEGESVFIPPLFLDDYSNAQEETLPASSAVDGISLPQTAKGTPIYLSPEELLSGDIDAILATQNTNTIIWTAKDDRGNLGYISSLDLAIESGASSASYALQQALETLLLRDDIFLIASVSCFSDEILSTYLPSVAFRRESGALWLDETGTPWLKPQEELVQNYILSICEELIALGFDEILFTEAAYPSMTDTVPVYCISSRENSQKVYVLEEFYTKCRELCLTNHVLSAILWQNPLSLEGFSYDDGQDLAVLLGLFQEIWLYATESEAQELFASRGLSLPESSLMVIPSKNEEKDHS